MTYLQETEPDVLLLQDNTCIYSIRRARLGSLSGGYCLGMAHPLVDVIYPILAEYYPPDQAFLTHRNAYELLIAVILSAQCTDERVNQVTPALFSAYPSPEALANASLEAIKIHIRSINFFNNKAKNIQATARSLLADFGGDVPDTLEAMIQLSGVGRPRRDGTLAIGWRIRTRYHLAATQENQTRDVVFLGRCPGLR